MILFPAIDILDNKVVRLLYGDRRQTTVYGEPLQVAERWTEAGAEYLHVVDLNAAFGDGAANTEVMKALFGKVKVPIQIGGGVRDMDKLNYYLEELGAFRVVLGTAVVENPEFCEAAAGKFGNRIVCGIDVKNGKVAIKGWMDKTEIDPVELANCAKSHGVDTVVYTDISRDGALSGANVEGTVEFMNNTGMHVITSGGIRSLKDIKELISHNVYGAILGKAIYAGNIDFRNALDMVRAYDAD